MEETNVIVILPKARHDRHRFLGTSEYRTSVPE